VGMGSKPTVEALRHPDLCEKYVVLQAGKQSCEQPPPASPSAGRWAWSASSARRSRQVAAWEPGEPQQQQHLRTSTSTSSIVTTSLGQASSVCNQDLVDRPSEGITVCFAPTGGDKAAPASLTGPPSDASEEVRLDQARQRQAESAASLRTELQGSAARGLVAKRYASWPSGTTLEVLTPTGEERREANLQGSLVRYLAEEHAFEIALSDGTLRIVPAQRVRRATRTAAPGMPGMQGAAQPPLEAASSHLGTWDPVRIRQSPQIVHRSPSPELLA